MSDSRALRRIACLQPSATAILAAVGALDRVVACTKYCADVVPDARAGGRIIIADSWSAKADEILEARPDLVIAAVPYQEEAVAQILKAGIRFLALAPHTLDDIYTDIAVIASIVGAEHEGARVIREMRSEIEYVRHQLAGEARKRVFCEEWGKPVIASQPWVAELVAVAGGTFLGDPGRQCDTNVIREKNPEVIIAAWCGAGERVPLGKLIVDRGWSNTSAAQSGDVYCISDELLNTPAPTLVRGLTVLAAAIHPECFRDELRPRSIRDAGPSR